jgi:hypothetical protein
MQKAIKSIIRIIQLAAEIAFLKAQVLFWRCFVSLSRLLARAGIPSARGSKHVPAEERPTDIRESASREKVLEFWRCLHTKKRLYGHFPWLSASEASRIPILDCKGFAVLLADYARKAGLDSKIMVGISADDRSGHAYVNISMPEGVRSFSAGDPFPLRENEIAAERHFAATYAYQPGA